MSYLVRLQNFFMKHDPDRLYLAKRIARSFRNDEDAPLLDQNLDAIYNINFGTIYDTGIWNNNGEWLPEYTRLEENGRIITIPNWAIRFVISENHIIELEKGLENCINKGILNIDCCRIIMCYGIDFCRIM